MNFTQKRRMSQIGLLVFSVGIAVAFAIVGRMAMALTAVALTLSAFLIGLGLGRVTSGVDDRFVHGWRATAIYAVVFVIVSLLDIDVAGLVIAFLFALPAGMIETSPITIRPKPRWGRRPQDSRQG